MHFSLWKLFWTKLVQSSTWKGKKESIFLFFVSFKTKISFHFYFNLTNLCHPYIINDNVRDAYFANHS